LQVLEAMQHDVEGLLAPIKQIRVDGGATRCNLLMQLQVCACGGALAEAPCFQHWFHRSKSAA